MTRRDPAAGSDPRRGRPAGRRAREVVVVREVRVPVEEFELDEGNLRRTGITPRELEILGLVAEGLSNRQIADRLFVTESTIKTHVYRLFDKLDVRRRVQAVQRGRELGLVPWGVNESARSRSPVENRTKVG